MSSLLPTPEPADPVEGEPGHFEHTNWVKRALKALDQGLLRKPAGSTPAGKLLGTTSENTWEPVDPAAIGSVPRGVIVAYNGDVAPTGWAICDGTNGTPNLTDKFILGATTPGKPGTARGSTGGTASVTLSAEQSGIPAHAHTAANATANHAHGNNTTDLSHKHGVWTTSDGGHSHPLWALQDVSLGSPNARRITGGAQGSAGGSWDGTSGGGHGHTADMDYQLSAAHQLPDTKAADALHTHTINANTKANASQPFDNRPPFYALVYIMKL